MVFGSARILLSLGLKTALAGDNRMNRIVIIKDVLASLDKHDVSYCILRNYDFLIEKREPRQNSERSVDMVVSNKDFKVFHNLLLSHGFIKRKKPSFSLKHIPYFRIDNSEIISFDVQLGGVHWNDICYLDEQHILNNRVKQSFFYTPSNNDMVVMLLVHSILGKRYFKPEYKTIILSLLPKIDENYVIDHLTRIFSRNKAIILFNLAKEGKFDDIINKKHILMSYFIFKSKKNVITFTRLFFRWLKWKKIDKSYPLISIIGPDGAGKSTMVESLAAYLRQNNRKVSVIYTGRGRNQLLPIRKVGNFYKSKERKNDRLRKTPKIKWRKVLYFMFAPVFTLDLLLRYLLIMLPKRKRHNIVITDRYCSDIFLMENVPLFFRKFLLSLFPKPSLTIYLYNSATVLHQRRPEESIIGLERQLKLFEKLGNYLRPIKILTNNKQEDSNQVNKVVMGYLLDNWY